MARKVSFLDIVRRCNSFYAPSSTRAQCIPLIVDDVPVGVIRPGVLHELRKYPDIFDCSSSNRVSFTASLNTPELRSEALARVLGQWRHDQIFWANLKGWRDEVYATPRSLSLQAAPLFWLERAAVPLFGTLGLGVHVNGFTRSSKDGRMMLWIARRSATKQTWPNYLDNFVAGGLPMGGNLMDNVVKECAEEAGIPEEIARRAVSVGAVSYFFELERGITPETQFVFDLELPEVRLPSPDFRPSPADGEVGSFHLWTVEETVRRLHNNEFKPNCAMVLIHFLIRHGIVDAHSEPDYLAIIEAMSMQQRWDAVGKEGVHRFDPYAGVAFDASDFQDPPGVIHD